MKRIGLTRLLPVAGAALAASVLAAAPAFASGPGGGQGNGNDSTGRGTIDLFCGEAEYTVVVPNPDNSNGVAQLLDAQGHLIPVTGVFEVVDTTTATVLDEEPFAHGQGHQNQDTIECNAVVFSATASDLGFDVLPGVAPTDTIVGSIDVQAVPKP